MHQLASLNQNKKDKMQKEIVELLARYDITCTDCAEVALMTMANEIDMNAILKNMFNPGNEAEH